MGALGTLADYALDIRDSITRKAMEGVLRPVIDRLSTHMIHSGALRNDNAATTSLLAEVATTGYAMVKGRLLTIAANTLMATPSGSVATDNMNVFCYFIDSESVQSVLMGTAGTPSSNIVFPDFPENKALEGLTLIEAATPAEFVGGTTAFGTTGITTVHIDVVGSLDPAALL